MEIAITSLLFIISSSVFAGMLAIIALSTRRVRNLADLEVEPEMRAETITREAYRRYLGSLARKIKEYLDESRSFPTEARRQFEGWTTHYWITTVEELKKRDKEATENALTSLGYHTCQPYEELPPYGRGPAPVVSR
ncbi:MAG: hypothetical protein Q8Q36_02370 [bacterium]|nr:hypothetical protein [bacterium]